MSRRKRPSTTFTPDARALALLREDTPLPVKRALRLALRGGKQPRRDCLLCGATGTYCEVWSSAETWKVDAPATAKTPKTRVYWLCSTHHAHPDREALRQKLEG